MKNIVFCFFIELVLISCHSKSASDVQFFPEYEITQTCPCQLVRDTAQENNIKRANGVDLYSYSCKQNDSIIYHFDVIINKERTYTIEQILTAIDSTLISKSISHKRLLYNNKQAIMIDYGTTKELEVLTDAYSYYFVLQSQDTTGRNFNNWINSVIFQ